MMIDVQLRGPRSVSIALVSAVALAAAILLGVGASPAAATPGTWLSRINGFRAQNGLSPLGEDSRLNQVAQAWTQSMATTSTMSHNPSLDQQLTIPWTARAENVGFDRDEATVFSSFVGSPVHRANLLGPFNAVGIGHVISGGRVWTTHVFVATAAPLQPPPPPAPAVTTTAAAARVLGGLWTTTNSGKVSARAGAPSFGQLDVAPNRPVVGMTGAPGGGGYWLVGGDGGIFSFGDAGFRGSTSGFSLNRPVVGMAATHSGRGYWLVASDGGIFSFGDAVFHGSTGSFSLNAPIVGMTASPTGRGYWLVASDGGIFAFGDTGFHGSAGSLRLVSPITGVTPSATGRGYQMVAADGGVFTYGDATFHGSLGGSHPGSPVVAMAATPTGRGYWLAKADSTTAAFGDAPAT